MSIEIKVTIPPALLKGAAIVSGALMDVTRAAGARVRTGLEAHFLRLGERPNKKNWPHKGFWAEISRAIGSNESGDAYRLTIADRRFWRKLKGGDPITNKDGGKYIALPDNAAAYAAGRPKARNYAVTLAPLYRKIDGVLRAVALATDVRLSKRTGRPYATGAGEIWYWLVTSANPPAEPEVRPDILALTDQAKGAAIGFLNRLTRRIQQGAIA
jgi:hypothetical protein